MSERVPLGVLRVVAWLSLYVGFGITAFFAAVSLIPVGPEGIPLMRGSSVGATVLIVLLPFVVGVVVWAVLMSLCMIAGALLDIRDVLYDAVPERAEDSTLAEAVTRQGARERGTVR